MRIAIVGSRGYPRIDLVTGLLHRLHRHAMATGQPITIVSGTWPGSRGNMPPGVDETAIATAQALEMPVAVYAADWKTYGKRAGPLRNRTIVENSDRLVAFWTLTTRGTADVLDLALAKGIVAKVYGPAGDEVGIDAVGEAVRGVLG